jgi:hypothetical protein
MWKTAAPDAVIRRAESRNGGMRSTTRGSETPRRLMETPRPLMSTPRTKKAPATSWTDSINRLSVARSIGMAAV